MRCAGLRSSVVCAAAARVVLLALAAPGGGAVTGAPLPRALAHASPLAARAPASTARARRSRSCRVLPADNPLNRDISHAPVYPRSAGYIAAIGAGGHLHADFGTNPSYGIPYAVVGPRQPKVPIAFTQYG